MNVIGLASVTLGEVMALASGLLEAADERMVATDREFVTYDHAAAEAMVLVSGCLDVALEHPETAALVLREGMRLLRSLPVPTGMGEFRRRLWAELRAQGLPAPDLALLMLVA